MNKKGLLISMMLVCVISFGCERVEIPKENTFQNILETIKGHIPAGKSYFIPSSEESEHLKESIVPINNTIEAIHSNIEKAEKTDDPEEQKGFYDKIKKKLLSYLTSDEGKDNQFTSEFQSVFFQTNFDEISDEQVRNILERISTGFDNAEVLLSKGINIARTIGSILLPVIELYTSGTVDPQSILILKDGGPLHQLAKILEKAQVGRHILATTANISNKVITKVKDVMKAPTSKVEKGVELVRSLFSSAKNLMMKSTKVSSFFSSSIATKQVVITKIATAINKHEESTEQQEKESKRSSSSQSSNLVDVEGVELENSLKKHKKQLKTFAQFASCAGGLQFQYFCSNKK